MFNVKCVRKDCSDYIVYNDNYEECELIARDELNSGRCKWCTYLSPLGEHYFVMSNL